MVEEVLAAHARAALRVGIVAPAEYARFWQIGREQIAQPVDAVTCCPRLVTVSIEAVHSDDAGVGKLCEERTGVDAYSTVGWVPSYTTCRP
jgi:hypothetical protein